MQPGAVPLAAALAAAAFLSSCSPLRSAPPAGGDGLAPAPGAGLILRASEGERRVRRPRPGSATAQTAPFILKVDPRNGASPELVMGFEEIIPGEAIQPHRHLDADEIVFVQRGSGVARAGTREDSVGPGATLYIPRNTVVSLRNTGVEPLGVAFVFSKPGFEQVMRDNSVPEGQAAVPLSAEEQAAIRARHRWHYIAGTEPYPGGPGRGGVILSRFEGERRITRPGPCSLTARMATPFVVKVDPRNGGSDELVMAYAEIAPGDAVPIQRHAEADEIIFVHRGSGLARVGDREAAVTAGATLYAPRGVPVALSNDGPVPLALAFFFSHPGPEERMRETSVPAGGTSIPRPDAGRARCAAGSGGGSTAPTAR